MFSKHTQQLGFTLIEMIVSLALFSVVVTVSVGALLMLVGTSEQLQGEQSVMTNLSFALDSMTREIRTGTYYYCMEQPDRGGMLGDSYNLDNMDGAGVDTQNCADGGSDKAYNGIAFREAGDSITGDAERILYFYDSVDKTIYRKVGLIEQPIVSDGVEIINADFIVTGAQAPTTNFDLEQPAVTIFIEAVDPLDSSGKVHRIQTTVTQRILDI